MTGPAHDTGNPPVKLSALPGGHGVVICDHVYHGKRAICDIYYYIGGEISMSCAETDCDSSDPADWHSVSMAAMRELDETLSGCPDIPQGYGFERIATGLPWKLCPHETAETEH